MGLHHHSVSSYDEPCTNVLVSNADGSAMYAKTVMRLGRPRSRVRAQVVVDGNPNPRKFEILRSLQAGANLVVEIRYPNCTNYEGRKVLVYKDADLVSLLKQAETTGVDPHFSARDDLITPFARLEPTEEGWQAAERLAGEA
jgi:hypothetical protein